VRMLPASRVASSNCLRGPAASFSARHGSVCRTAGCGTAGTSGGCERAWRALGASPVDAASAFRGSWSSRWARGRWRTGWCSAEPVGRERMRPTRAVCERRASSWRGTRRRTCPRGRCGSRDAVSGLAADAPSPKAWGAERPSSCGGRRRTCSGRRTAIRAAGGSPRRSVRDGWESDAPARCRAEASGTPSISAGLGTAKNGAGGRRCSFDGPPGCSAKAPLGGSWCSRLAGALLNVAGGRLRTGTALASLRRSSRLPRPSAGGTPGRPAWWAGGD